MTDRVAHGRDAKTKDRAAVLLIAGILLSLPPLARIFEIEAKILGLPVTLIYLFAVWAGLIVSARLLARGLIRQDLAEAGIRNTGAGHTNQAPPPGTGRTRSGTGESATGMGTAATGEGG